MRLIDADIVLKTATCPGNIYRPVTRDYLSMYRAFKQGNLPYAGSYAEQPSKIFEVFQIIDGHYKMVQMREIAEDNLKKKAKTIGR